MFEPSGDLLGHLATSAIGLAASGIGLYVSNKLLKQREWFRIEMTNIIKENCAGKVEFEAHSKADDVFQRTLTADIAEKRLEYKKQHLDHYEHANKTEIHQASMPSDLLKEKFDNVKEQVADVRQRVEKLTVLVESKIH